MSKNNAALVMCRDAPTMPVLIHHYRIDELSQGHVLTQYNGYDQESALHTVAALCMELGTGTIVVYRDGAPIRHIEVK